MPARAPRHERRAARLVAARGGGGGAACRIARWGGRGRIVEDQVRDRHAADAVDEAVVDLRDEAPAAAGEAVEQRDLPQGPAAVEPVGVEVRQPVEQLGVAARSGQGRVAHVGGDVEVRVRLPVRPAQPARVRVREPLAEARHRLQAPVEQRAHVLDRRDAPARQRVEHHRPADVHVRALVGLLQLEERGIEWCELLSGHAYEASAERVAAIRSDYG